MSFPPRLGLARALMTAAALTVVLGGCSFAPYQVDGSDAATDSAEAQSADLLPRLQPRALGICYSPAFNDLAEVEAEAVYRCDGGRLEKLDEDVFWNGCSMSQPNRINYICYPPDKAKRLDDGS